jgi:hypothetical protein
MKGTHFNNQWTQIKYLSSELCVKASEIIQDDLCAPFKIKTKTSTELPVIEYNSIV